MIALLISLVPLYCLILIIYYLLQKICLEKNASRLIGNNNAKDTNYFTKFLQIANVVSDYW